MKKEIYPQKCPICQDWVELKDMTFCKKEDHIFILNKNNFTYYHIILFKEDIDVVFSVGNNYFDMATYSKQQDIYSDREELTWDMVGEKIKKLLKMRVLL